MRIRTKRVFVLLSFLVLFLGIGISSSFAESILRMATTTSTDNTGLLEYLAPEFKTDTGIELQWVAVGTGKALALGKNCDVDVLLVHAPEAEKTFVEEGYGIDRVQIMFNDFVIIGPEKDTAGIKGKSAKESLRLIAERKTSFASRGDNSGTHKKELSLWESAGLAIPDKETWYIQTGQGMLNTINISAERDAYTLTDRGTYIKYESNWKGNPPLTILVESDVSLRNQYSVIAINPARCAAANYQLAKKFSEWMASPRTQKLISEFKLMGKQLFIPNAHGY